MAAWQTPVQRKARAQALFPTSAVPNVAQPRIPARFEAHFGDSTLPKHMRMNLPVHELSTAVGHLKEAQAFFGSQKRVAALKQDGGRLVGQTVPGRIQIHPFVHDVQSVLMAVAQCRFHPLSVAFVDVAGLGLPFAHPKLVAGIALVSPRSAEVGNFAKGIGTQVVIDFPEQVGAFYIHVFLFERLGDAGL